MNFQRLVASLATDLCNSRSMWSPMYIHSPYTSDYICNVVFIYRQSTCGRLPPSAVPSALAPGTYHKQSSLIWPAYSQSTCCVHIDACLPAAADGREMST